MPFFYFPIAFLSILLIIIYLFIFGVSFFSVPPTNQLNRTLNLKVGASLGGQHSDAGRVAGLAEDVSIQRVAALVISFRQEATTILGKYRQMEMMHTNIQTIHVKIKFFSFPFKALKMWPLFFPLHIPPGPSNPSPVYNTVCLK